MKNPYLAFQLILVSAMGLEGCAGLTSQKSTNPGAVAVAAFLTDTPADSVLAFRIDVTGAALVGPNGVPTSIANETQQVELRHLQLAPTLAFQTANAPAGTYTDLQMTFANPQITLTDSAGNVTTLDGSSTPSVQLASVSVKQSVNFTTGANGATGVTIDFDVRDSIQIASNGNYVIKPVVNAGVVSSSPTEPNLENAEGIILSSPAGDTYNLLLQDTGQVVQVRTNAQTILTAGGSQTTTPFPGQSVEVDAELQSDGSFLATRIDEISSSPGFLRYGGVVIGVIADSSGNTSLALVVQD